MVMALLLFRSMIIELADVALLLVVAGCSGSQ
jgi:hypothetical protein